MFRPRQVAHPGVIKFPVQFLKTAARQFTLQRGLVAEMPVGSRMTDTCRPGDGAQTDGGHALLRQQPFTGIQQGIFQVAVV